jgi:hypothetical protein
VFTICLPRSLTSENMQAITAVYDSLNLAMDLLKPDDYVYFNIGNSSEILLNDKCTSVERVQRHTNIREWMSLNESNQNVFKVLERSKT